MRLFFIFVFFLFHPFTVFSAESILDQLYREGGQAWLAGQTQVALNAWLKYREIARRLNESSRSSRDEEIEFLSQQAKLKLKKEAAVPMVVPSPAFLPEKRKTTRPKSREKTVSVKRDPALLNRLMVQAQRASESGRLEEARRLYLLALQVSPNDSNAENNLKNLEQVMEEN